MESVGQIAHLESPLESPIDVMFLIHKALSADAARVEEMVRSYGDNDTIQSINMAFNLWAASLVFHADQEDQYMTGRMPDFPPARDNEAEHAQLGEMLAGFSECLKKDDARGLEQRVKDAMMALHEQQHEDLMLRLEDVMAVLHDEIGKGKVVARTQRHLYQKVVALRVAQDDHFECEEEFVLPEIRQRFSEDQQLEIVRHLLVDEQAEDPRWVIDWMAEHLTAGELEALDQLEARFSMEPVAGD